MREILFRAKLLYNGEWVYSTGFKRDSMLVNLETVGQYTGLTDNNGAKIFEGDVVKCDNEFECDSGIGLVEWLENYGLWYVTEVNNGLGDLCHGSIEVVGNIHDNPERLKGE